MIAHVPCIPVTSTKPCLIDQKLHTTLLNLHLKQQLSALETYLFLVTKHLKGFLHMQNQLTLCSVD